MDLEDKKVMAEFLGWEFLEGQNAYDYVASDGREIDLLNFNPDTSHEQFYEVWEKMTPGQQSTVLQNCESMDTAEIISALLSKDGLKEFFGFVLQVIR